jgi:hypothetical protein
MPSASGNKIIRLRPNSSTVAVKSVPRMAIFAVGVWIVIFSLSILPSCPVINLAVPLAKFRASLELDGLGSKMYSSMVS